MKQSVSQQYMSFGMILVSVLKMTNYALFARFNRTIQDFSITGA